MKTQMRDRLHCCLIIVAAMVFAIQSQAADPDKPNVLFIMADGSDEPFPQTGQLTAFYGKTPLNGRS